MSGSHDRLTALLAYVQENGRICPQPQQWHELWELLPDKKRVGMGWDPPSPLILGAWWYTSALEKHLRFREHIEYAALKGALETVDGFLRSLTSDQWFVVSHRS